MLPSLSLKRMYTPPFAPLKYGSGYSGMSFDAIAFFILPNTIGDAILSQCGQAEHVVGSSSANLAHVYGPFIRSLSLLSDTDCILGVSQTFYAPLSASLQNLAIDKPALHKGSLISC